ncbi:MAG: hypothetical protein K2X48_03320 [Chitinophagaceae bacterium]|nr:hypothetical protein [Chitinophagaceae bacterium]
MKTLIIYIHLFVLVTTKSFCQLNRDSTLILQSDDYSNNKNRSSNTLIYPVIEKKGNDTSKISLFRGTYEEAINLADLYFQKNKYEISAAYFEIAFKNNNNRGKVKDRYKAACAYAALKNNDSAFAQLFKIVKGTPYYDIPKLENEVFFLPLKPDKRWKELISYVEENIKKITEGENKN